MKRITGADITLYELFEDAMFGIPYFQREYRWEEENVTDLINDLITEFRQQEGRSYYFLGSIILSEVCGKREIVDGQQRLTTLTLLLIYLLHMQKKTTAIVKTIDLLIRTPSEKFRLDIPDRSECMQAILNEKDYDCTGKSVSVKNLVTRYATIKNKFPKMTSAELAEFTTWLMRNVQFVKVVTNNQGDAYRIFETMNDRGLPLTPTEMLLGYILDKIDDSGDDRFNANNCIKEYLEKFEEYRIKIYGANSKRDVAHDFFVAWLRAQYAEKIPEDYDRIATKFHRWVRDNEERLHLKESSDFYHLATKSIPYFADLYLRLLDASKKREDGTLCYVKYNADIPTSLQYYFMFASVKEGEDKTKALPKMALVADFIDSWLSMRSWRGWIINYSLVEVRFFNFAKAIREMDSIEDMRNCLLKQFDYNYDEDDDERKLCRYPASLHQGNSRTIHRILARISDHFDGKYEAYVSLQKNDPCTIEHIFPAKYNKDKYDDEFSGPEEYAALRNNIGALVLLPGSVNSSLSDKHYCKKRDYYARLDTKHCCSCILAASLHEDSYKKGHPLASILAKAKKDGFDFQPYKRFGKKEIQARNKLYAKIADAMWSPDAFKARSES